MEKTIISEKTFDEERALYGSRGIVIENCRFDGPADGESALKESRDIDIRNSYFNLRYPFWHDDKLTITDSVMTDKCRAALWYTNRAKISNSNIMGIKAMRECSEISINGCDINSPEFGWSVRDIEMQDCRVQSEYFMMRSERLHFKEVSLNGKYSFQYIKDSDFENCVFDTKDAFWHAKNVIVSNSFVKGEYLAWYSENVTFINCTIIGTQPFCYSNGLKLIDCKMIDTDLAFEKTDVEATILTPVISIKNPKSGHIYVKSVGEIIMDDPDAKGVVKTIGHSACA